MILASHVGTLYPKVTKIFFYVFFKVLNYFYIYLCSVCMCVFVCVSVCVCVHACLGGERITWGSPFSSSSMWILGIKLRLPSLVAYTYQAILLIHSSQFCKFYILHSLNFIWHVNITYGSEHWMIWIFQLFFLSKLYCQGWKDDSTVKNTDLLFQKYWVQLLAPT